MFIVKWLNHKTLTVRKIGRHYNRKHSNINPFLRYIDLLQFNRRCIKNIPEHHQIMLIQVIKILRKKNNFIRI